MAFGSVEEPGSSALAGQATRSVAVRHEHGRRAPPGRRERVTDRRAELHEHQATGRVEDRATRGAEGNADPSPAKTQVSHFRALGASPTTPVVRGAVTAAPPVLTSVSSLAYWLATFSWRSTSTSGR